MIGRIYTCVNGGIISVDYSGTGFSEPGPTVPAWLTYSVGPHGLLTITVTDATVAGSYNYTFGDLTLIVFVSELCFQEYEPCCRNNNYFNIEFVNIYGGRQNYIFDGVYTMEGRTEGGEQVFETDFTLKYSDVGNVYDGIIATVRDIPSSHLAVIWALKNSIQCRLFNFETSRFDIPIIVDRESFTKRKSKDKFFTASIRFRYAERIRIQSQ